MNTLARTLIGTTSALALAAGLALATTDALAAGAATEAGVYESIVLGAGELPPPLARSEPAHLQVVLETIEREAELADGTIFRYWTFDGKVPGPFIRARVGDTIDVTLINPDDSHLMHSVDFHAVTGPGGGAVATQTAPGEETRFTFKAINPGIYVYHCATPMVADHIQAGMYGLILVEPEEGLPAVDREFYVMQGEIYTEQRFGTRGEVYTDYDKLLDEQPEYYVFNGAVAGLTGEMAMTASVGETVRIYFGVGGPNKTSSFHVIGEIMDRVYNHGSLNSPPATDVQTVSVAPGGAVAVDITFEVPGRYIVVDHALSRLERGLVAEIVVDGLENAEIFDTGDAELNMAGH